MQSIKSRQRNLFKLLTNESSYVPASVFAELLGVSLKTIYNDLAMLSEEMKHYQLYIDKIPRNGLILVGDKKNQEKFLNKLNQLCCYVDVLYTPSHRRLEIMRMLLIEIRHVTIADLEDIFYVTSASLRSDMELLQQFLKPFHVHLYTGKSKIKVKGCESNIQKALKQFILLEAGFEGYDTLLHYDPLHQLVEQLFDERIITMSKDRIHHLVQTSNRSISDYYVNSIYVSLLILLTRIQHGFHMQEDDVKNDDISLLEPYMIAIEMKDSYEKQYGLDFCEADVQYLSLQLFAYRIEPSIKGGDIQSQYLGIVHTMIAKMSRLLETDLTDDERLLDSLLYHIPPMIYRLKRNMKVYNPLLQQIKNQYIILFSLTWYIASDLETQYQVILNDDEISFLFIYFQISLEKRHDVHFKNIVIVCPMGLATSELVFTKVRQFLPPSDNVFSVNVAQLYAMDLRNVDIIISTTTLSPLTPPVVYVSPLVSDEDIRRIAQAYSLLHKGVLSPQSTYINCQQTNLMDFIREEFLFVQEEFATKEECLNFLIGQYQACNMVSETFGRSLYEREEMGDTSMYTGVAIPHPMPETVTQSRIAIATMTHKIRWGSNDVNMVIVIGIAEKDIQCVKGVLSQILAICESKEKIKTVVQIENRNELYQYLCTSCTPEKGG